MVQGRVAIGISDLHRGWEVRVVQQDGDQGRGVRVQRRHGESIQPELIRAMDTPRELLHEQSRDLDVPVRGRAHEWRVVVDITADLDALVAGLDEVLGDFDEAVGRGEVEAGITFVLEVGVLDEFGVVADDAFHEDDIVEEDGSPEASGGIDPVPIVLDVVRTELNGERHTSPHVCRGLKLPIGQKR